MRLFKRKDLKDSTLFYDIEVKDSGFIKIKRALTTPAAFFVGCLILVVAIVAGIIIATTPPVDEIEQNSVLFNSTEPIEIQDVSDFNITEREIMLRVRKIGDPYVYGDEALFAGGTDSAGNPKLRAVYHYDFNTNVDSTVSQIILQNDDIMNIVFNEKYIVWADSDRNGGCIIRYLNRDNQAIRTVKSCSISTPKLELEDNLICWVERTANKQDKLYLYDLDTSESVTLAVFKNSASGVSPPGMGGSKIAWVEDDETGDQIGYSVIKILDIETGDIQVYSTGMYAFAPKTNGDVVVWIDQNRGPDASLFMMRGQSIYCIEDGGVDNFDLGDDFVAYHKDGALYVYQYDTNKRMKINRDDEDVILSGVYGKSVVWFDVSNDAISRDIVYVSTVDTNPEEVKTKED